jgi:protein ImuB
MRRVISLWLPMFATDRLRRRRTAARPAEPATASIGPLATITAAHGGMRVVAVNLEAAAVGVAPGMPLAEARAVLPNLAVAGADPAGDRALLESLADWCVRYTPWTAADADSPRTGGHGGDAGIWLDITGCAHLFDGEAALLADLVDRLGRFRLAAAATVADTPGAAWAVARFGGARTAIIAPGDAETALAPLPIAGLRLPPATIADLDMVGLRRIGDLMALPRAPLAARFGDAVLKSVDRALGHVDEPISPRWPVPAFRVRLAFAEPIGRQEDIAATARQLLGDLCQRLEAARRGVRRLELALFRTDGTVARAAIGTARPVRDPDHLARLFREKLDGLDPGFGVETAILAATVVEPLAAVQTTLQTDAEGPGEDLARLLDRLGNRLHPGNVVRLTARASHLPERACRPVPAASPAPSVDQAAAATEHRPRQPRPAMLLPTPEPVQVVTPLPDGPPVLMQHGRSRHRIVAAEGPERIAPEWWLEDDGLTSDRLARTRDYYRLEDDAGCRLWVFREGPYRADAAPRWYLHGLFG